MTREDQSTIKWIKAVAAWFLFVSTLSITLYILILLSLISESSMEELFEGGLTYYDHFDFLFHTALGLISFFGLWNLRTWGWRFVVITTPVTWVLSLYQIATTYEPGSGIALAIFLFIDAAILRLLFQDGTKKIFSITDKRWLLVRWLPTASALGGCYFMALDLYDGFVALVTVIALIIGTQVARRATRRLKEKE